MRHHHLDRRALLKVSVGGVAAAVLAVPARWVPAARAAQADLAFQGSIEFWDWEFEPRQAAADAIIADWEQRYPEIDLSYQFLPYADAETRLLTAATAGEGPPFANVHFNWRVDLQRAGVLVPYPADLFDYDELISTPFNAEPGTGSIFTSTFAIYTDQVYFNTALLDAQGISAEAIPRTWDDYIQMCIQLTQRDGDRLVQAGWSLNHYYSREWLWTSLIYQQGGYLYNEDGTEALWNSDESVAALQMLQDVYHVHRVDDPTFLDMFDAFGGGVAATYISQGYTGAGWTPTDFPDLTWGTAVTPTFTGSPEPSWGLMTPEEGFCVFTSASPEEQAVAFQFINELVGTDEQRIAWALISNGPPDKLSLANSPAILENQPGNSITTQAETLPYRINYGERPLEAEPIWRTMFDELILNRADPRAVADTATEQMNAALAASGKQRLFTERLYQIPGAGAGAGATPTP
ncbi:MAG: extracellular solute-binding protein [Chloroflexia bacterium]|nr:extracellular solute-binding protein [Chloroflexia bacterium]